MKPNLCNLPELVAWHLRDAQRAEVSMNRRVITFRDRKRARKEME